MQEMCNVCRLLWTDFRGYIQVRIVNHDEYEKNQNFLVELGEPRHITSDKPSASITYNTFIIQYQEKLEVIFTIL